MPGVPEQSSSTSKREDKEVESATQTDDDNSNSSSNSIKKDPRGKEDFELSPQRVEELKKDPKVVVHCELQEELDREIEAKGLHFDKPGKAEGGDDKEEDNKQKAGDDRA